MTAFRDYAIRFANIELIKRDGILWMSPPPRTARYTRMAFTQPDVRWAGIRLALEVLAAIAVSH
ncbi:hypothetical protein D3C85_815380 [compost metagenome]